jgi:hypothetical protein
MASRGTPSARAHACPAESPAGGDFMDGDSAASLETGSGPRGRAAHDNDANWEERDEGA